MVLKRYDSYAEFIKLHILIHVNLLPNLKFMQKAILDQYTKKNRLTVEQVREFYEIEKRLANRLRNSTREERKYLYSSLYNELFKTVPYHPQLLCKLNLEDSTRIGVQSMQFLGHFLNSDSVFLEVGPGDCSVSLAVAKHVKKVYAVDVSNEITKNLTLPSNFELIISDGVSIPVPAQSINVIYSDQLMEHLHPDDAITQLQNIHELLVSGGMYICSTPNRLSGPHDVSQCFDEIATGFHLKEYLISELSQLFREAGFSQVSLCKKYKQFYIILPLSSITVYLINLSEKLISILPYNIRRKLANKLILFRGTTVIGTK